MPACKNWTWITQYFHGFSNGQFRYEQLTICPLMMCLWAFLWLRPGDTNKTDPTQFSGLTKLHCRTQTQTVSTQSDISFPISCISRAQPTVVQYICRPTKTSSCSICQLWSHYQRPTSSVTISRHTHPPSTTLPS